MPRISDTQKKVVKILVQNISNLDDRWPNYKEGLLTLVTDILQLQRDFELKISGSIVPNIKDKVDAFAQEFDNQ